MRYVFAVLFPPLAVLMCGKPFQFLLNIVLSLLYVPGLIHALMVVSAWERRERLEELAVLAGIGRKKGI